MSKMYVILDDLYTQMKPAAQDLCMFVKLLAKRVNAMLIKPIDGR